MGASHFNIKRPKKMYKAFFREKKVIIMLGLTGFDWILKTPSSTK